MTDEIIKGKIARLRKEFAETKGYECDKNSRLYYIRGVNSTGMLGDILYVFREIVGEDSCCDIVYNGMNDIDSIPGKGFVHMSKPGLDIWDFGKCEIEMEGSVDNMRCYYTKRLNDNLVYEISITMSPASHTYKLRFIGNGEEKEVSFDR